MRSNRYTRETEEHPEAAQKDRTTRKKTDNGGGGATPTKQADEAEKGKAGQGKAGNKTDGRGQLVGKA